jgi:uncharacterized protein YeaO (DUF488 family)
MTIKIKRIYEGLSAEDGYRILVDRLWPRGMTKETAHVDLWLKDIAPSTELRQWFDHDPAKWTGFCRKYQQELKGSAAMASLKELLRTNKKVTLLYSAKDELHNQAKALMEMIGDV